LHSGCQQLQQRLIEADDRERTKATLRGHAVTVKKLKQAGYANLDSWEDIVKEIEGPVYVDNGLKWYWVR
jgi:hypothetical protein